MPKINTFDAKRPFREYKKFVVSDEDHQDEVELTLQDLDCVDSMIGSTRADELKTIYIDGINGAEPIAFPPIGGIVYKDIPYTLMANAAIIEAMQCPENANDKYTAEELIALAYTHPKAWRKITMILAEYLSVPYPN